MICRFCAHFRSGTITQLSAGSTSTPVFSSPASVFVRHQSQALPKETEDPLPPPQPSGAAKQHTPKIASLVDQISQLTLAEVADLTDLLKVITVVMALFSTFLLSCFAWDQTGNSVADNAENS